MRKSILFVISIVLSAQSVEVVALTPSETKELSALRDESDRLFKAWTSASQKYCDLQTSVKSSHRAVDTAGSTCGSSSKTLTGVAVSSTSSVYTEIRWEFDRELKFLVRR